MRDYRKSLCFDCKWNDYEHMREIRAAYREAGLELPTHVWCAVNDRPEDVRWVTCAYLDE